MNLLPPLPIMEKWRAEGLTPEQVKARADLWVREARRALRQPIPPKPKPKPMPTLGSVTGLKPGPRPGIPRRFPPRPKDGRSKPANQARPVTSKLPDLETLVALYQTHTIQEIAGIYKASPESVRRRLKKVNAVAAKRLALKQAREERLLPLPLRVNIKLPSVEQLEELYKDHTLREIGAMYGASTEAVAHHLRKTGAIERKRKDKEATDLAQIRVMIDQGMSWDRLAKTLHRSWDYLRRLAKEAGIEISPRLTLGCPKCDDAPYAKGLCRRCYNWLGRNKARLSPEEQAKVKERAKLSRGPGKYHRGLRPETIEKARRIKALRDRGLTFKQIHTVTGIWDSTACRLLKRCRDYLDKQPQPQQD